MILYQEKTGMERLLIDWSNSTVREGAATPESKRKIGAIPQTIAKNTVCKKFKVSISDPIECPLLAVLIDFYRIKYMPINFTCLFKILMLKNFHRSSSQFARPFIIDQ